MGQQDAKELCMKLLYADTEEEVISLLSERGFWQNDQYWRYLGDTPHNYATTASQQSHAEQAIVEKLTNSIDAKLLAACQLNGIDPESEDAPKTMQEAREKFFPENSIDSTKLSKSITLSATGYSMRNGNPSFTIVDDGEGQTPEKMHDTILSLNTGNKDPIGFVQGKFNMGGTGTLRFCGKEHNIQFVLSKRHPQLTNGSNEKNSHWSYTIIRRNDPPKGRKLSKYVYLAPLFEDIFCDEKEKNLLSFPAETLKIFPDKNSAYAREAGWGTCFKLYEYESEGFKSHLLRRGLRYRIQVLLPNPILPVKFYECRKGYTGDEGRSFDANMIGLMQTLQNNWQSPTKNNLEYYDKIQFKVGGYDFETHIYLFKDKETASTYVKNEGVIFSYNGQSHATMSKDFFRRKNVGHDYLYDSLLVILDCTKIDYQAHDKLFMASRDRLCKGDFSKELQAELESIIKDDPELRNRANERRKKQFIRKKTKISDSTAKIMEDLLKNNPMLRHLFDPGTRLKTPFPLNEQTGGKGRFKGERFPTYFHFKKIGTGEKLIRDAPLNQRCRIKFETDAENEYFSRQEDPGTFNLLVKEPGEFDLFVKENEKWIEADDYRRPNLHNGIANFSMLIPKNAQVGEEIEYKAVLTDPSRIEPIENIFILKVQKEINQDGGGSGKRDTSANKDNGFDKRYNKDGKQNKSLQLLDIPNPARIAEDKWTTQNPHFNEHTAMRINKNPNSESDSEYDYYINIGNIHLRNYQKHYHKKARELEEKFVTGMVLITLSLIYQNKATQLKKTEDYPKEEYHIADRVQEVTSAIAPFLLPLIDDVSKITVAEDPYSSSAGEDD